MKYVKGILGGLIGGIIGALPWVLVYVYANYLLSLLAAVIAFGIAFGYKLFKGPKTKAYPVIVGVLSVAIVIVTTLVIIPLALRAQAGLSADFEALSLLYENSEFVSGIMRDLVVSIVFTILGVSGVVAQANKEAVLEAEEKEEQEKNK